MIYYKTINLNRHFTSRNKVNMKEICQSVATISASPWQYIHDFQTLTQTVRQNVESAIPHAPTATAPPQGSPRLTGRGNAFTVVGLATTRAPNPEPSTRPHARLRNRKTTSQCTVLVVPGCFGAGALRQRATVKEKKKVLLLRCSLLLFVPAHSLDASRAAVSIAAIWKTICHAFVCAGAPMRSRSRTHDGVLACNDRSVGALSPASDRRARRRRPLTLRLLPTCVRPRGIV